MQQVGGSGAGQGNHEDGLSNGLFGEGWKQQPIQGHCHVVDQRKGHEQWHHKAHLAHSVPAPRPHTLSVNGEQFEEEVSHVGGVERR